MGKRNLRVPGTTPKRVSSFIAHVGWTATILIVICTVLMIAYRAHLIGK